MATAPYGVRLLVGAAVTALEETRKLPQTILMYPMIVGTAGEAPEHVQVVDLPVRDGERLTEGRFALFSGEPETSNATPSPEPVTTEPAAGAVPEIVTELGYQDLTLAQLRARLTTLRVADLEELLSYEESTKARAPFQTLLANRITRASAK